MSDSKHEQENSGSYHPGNDGVTLSTKGLVDLASFVLGTPVRVGSDVKTWIADLGTELFLSPESQVIRDLELGRIVNEDAQAKLKSLAEKRADSVQHVEARRTE